MQMERLPPRLNVLETSRPIAALSAGTYTGSLEGHRLSSLRSFLPWMPSKPWPCSMVSINHTDDHSGLVVSPYPSRDVQRLKAVSPPEIQMLRLNPYVMIWLPWWLSGEESALQCRRYRRLRFKSLGQEDCLEKGMATHSSILAWRLPLAEEPGVL